jgi:RNA polymerase-binding protein DksA
MDSDEVRRRLEPDRDATAERRQQLAQMVADIQAAQSDVATDDEHDPEGATIAYERARTVALVAQAEEHLSEIDRALARLENGSYGNCESCGLEITAARLEARPVVRTCITCATKVN